MPCSNCDNPKVFSRGLCSGCYHRLRRRGTVARKNVVNQGACKEEGCGRQAFSKNLCSLHYQRSQHPLYSTWQTLRSRAQGAYPKEWDKFDSFLACVGERPSPTHQLRRPNPEIPWGLDNMVWREPIGIGYKAETKAYAWRWHIRNRYGLTIEQVEAMHASQVGTCPGCRLKFGEADPRNGGKPLEPRIDHCHVSRRVRGILCDACNKALGAVYDDPETVRGLLEYLLSTQQTDVRTWLAGK